MAKGNALRSVRAQLLTSVNRLDAAAGAADVVEETTMTRTQRTVVLLTRVTCCVMALPDGVVATRLDLRATGVLRRLHSSDARPCACATSADVVRSTKIFFSAGKLVAAWIAAPRRASTSPCAASL